MSLPARPATDDLNTALARLTPEQRALFERRRAAQGLDKAPAGAPAAVAIDTLQPRGGEGPAPLSFAQQRLWFLQRLAPESSAYNVASVLRLRGKLDVPRLAQALGQLVQRHEILRSAYPADADGQPRQVPQPLQALPQPLLQQEDAGADSDSPAIQASLQARLQALAQAPFDLAQVPLRLVLLRHGPQDHRLLLVTHHIASDRWSVAVFLRELGALYRGEALEPLPIQYADWALWQQQQLQGDELARLADWWRGQLGGDAGEGTELPLLELPLDHPRPPVATDRGAQHPLQLPPGLSAALRGLAQRRQVTLFMLLLAAFKVLLHRLSGSADVVVGTEVANRERAQTAGLIGLLVNTLVLRTRFDTSAPPRFDTVLAQVRRGFLDAMAHQALPFEKLVELLKPERHLDQMVPLFQAKFDLQPATPQGLDTLRLGEALLSREPLPETRTKYELRFNLVDAPEGLRGQIEYRADLFEPDTIAGLARQFEALLTGIVAQPEASIARLPLLDTADRAAVLAASCAHAPLERPFNLDEATGQTLDGLVWAQAARTPQALAVSDGHTRWTYAQLCAGADALAATLRSLRAQEEPATEPADRPPAQPVVGVYMPRSARLLMGLLAVLRSGAAYVPLDPEYPAARLDFIVQDAGVRCVLVDAPDALVALAQAATLQPVLVHDPLAEDTTNPAASGTAPPAEPERLAYLIYTSGSTGRPKGVAIAHRSAVRRMLWARDRFGAPALHGMLASTSVCFDLSVFELFAPLAWGGHVVVAEHALALPRLLGLLARQAAAEVRFVNSVPSVLQQLLDGAGLPSSVRHVGLAGEPLPPALVQRLRALPHIDAVHNLYGPSEDTTYSTEASFPGCHGGPDTAPVRRVPIGTPLPGTQAYVVDVYGELLPPGVAGELLLGGQGLAQGYLGRPGLSAERFVPNPFRGAPEPGAAQATPHSDRLYRTGDRVRRDRQGQLHFLGRADHQVKIRGFRIETGEVEHVLREHPGLADAVVAAPVGADGQRRLIAQVEPVESAQGPAGQALQAEDLRQWLAQRLPGHLVPGRWQLLATLPRLPNGKLDRHALAALAAEDPEAQAGATPYVAPRNEAEQRLAALWQQSLKRDAPVGVQHNFFALGGHSLLAIDLVARIERAWGRPLPLRALFEAPTVAQLAARLSAEVSGHDAAQYEPTRAAITPDAAQALAPFPLTDIQQAYLMGRHAAFELGQVATHGYREIEASGLAPEAVAAALNQLVQRHAMLRAVVTPEGQQRVLAQVPALQIPTQHLHGLPAAEREAALLQLRERLSHQRFEPQQWPLFELQASQLSAATDAAPARWRYHLSFDVLIGDAFSFQLLGRELAALLQGHTLPPLSLQFRDCVLAEQAHAASPAGQAALAWWRNRLDSLPPAPELPRQAASAGPRDKATFVRRSSRLAAPAWARLQARGQAQGLTPSALLLTALAQALAGFCRRADFTLNLTLFNRPRLHPEIDRVVGDFTASLLLAVHGRPGEPFAAAAQRLQQRLWADLEQRSVSGVRVQRELAQRQQRGGQALFPVVFTSTLGHSAAPAGATPWATELVWGVSQTSQVLLDHQVSELQGVLHINWDALDALFPPGLLAQLQREHLALLQALADEPEAWTRRSAPVAPERLAAHAALNTAADEPTPAELAEGQPRLLHHLAFSAAQRHPLRPAVIAPERTLSHAALAHEALALAQRLQAAGVQRGDLVAVGCAKGWRQAVAVLAVLSAGAAYVPVDPALPAARRAQVLADGAVRVVLVDHDAAGGAPTEDWPADVQRIAIAAPAGPAPTQAPPLPPARQRPEDLAYVLYTSGSTGTPKGVMIDHRGAVNTVLDINRRHGLTPEDRVFGLSSLSFDLSVWDLFGPLAEGGALVLPAPDELQQPAAWPARLAAHGVTLWNSVPALLQLLLDVLPPGSDTPAAVARLRRVLLSGDWIPLALPGALAARCPQAQLYSLGGATEASIWSIAFPVPAQQPLPADWRSLPYGHPLAGQPWYVLDAGLRPCAPGVPGELYIAGIGVARGYWRRPALTAERFVPNPFVRPGDRTGQVLYRTGDLGVLRPEGWIEFLGREDQQVKLNGHRIELGEIEALLQRHPSLAGAAVALSAAPGQPAALSAYVVPRLQGHTAAAPGQPGWRLPPRTGEVLALPEPADPAQAGPQIARQSQRRFLPAPLPLATLANTLAALRAHHLPGAAVPKFDYPSAGHLYPLQAWLQVQPGRVQGLAGGWYVYHPGQHQLHRVAAAPALDDAALARLYGDNTALAAERAFGLVLVAALPLLAQAYGERARDFALLEAGHAAQALMARAAQDSTQPASDASAALGLCALGGMDLPALRQHLPLGEGAEPLYALMGGAIAPAWAHSWQGGQAPAPSERTAEADTAAPINEQLRAWLAQQLPAYMLPARWVLLPALPLTPNGKLDRAALPAPSAERAHWRAAQSDTERRVVAAWQQVLKLDRVGLDDDFFAVGGQSIAALQLLTQLQQGFGLPLTLAELLGALSPAAQAALIDAKTAAQAKASMPAPAETIPRLARQAGAAMPSTPSSEPTATLSDAEVDKLLAQLLQESTR